MKIRKNSSYKLSNLLSYSSGLCSSSAAAAHEQKHVSTETSHFYIPLKCHVTQSVAVCVFSEDFWVLKHINKHKHTGARYVHSSWLHQFTCNEGLCSF